MNTKKNQNYNRIDGLIIEALCRLIKTKAEEDISVTLLCQKAKINRTTFYKHYRGVWEAMDKIEDMLIEDVVKAYRENVKANKTPDIYAFFRSINEGVQKDLDFCRKLLISRRTLHIVDKLNNVITNFLLNLPEIKKMPKSSPEIGHINASIELFVGGVCSAYIRYIRGAANYSLDDIAFCIDRHIKDLRTKYSNKK